MKLWMSGEIESDVGEMYRLARNLLEMKVNESLNDADYGDGLVEWAYVAMIYGTHSPKDWPEFVKYHKDRKVFETRLRIDHAAFKSADLNARVALLVKALLKSLDLMEQRKIKDIDVARLRSDFTRAASENGWLNQATA